MKVQKMRNRGSAPVSRSSFVPQAETMGEVRTIAELEAGPERKEQFLIDRFNSGYLAWRKKGR